MAGHRALQAAEGLDVLIARLLFGTESLVQIRIHHGLVSPQILNRAVDGLYPAGSTIKPFVAMAALQEKTIKPDTKLDTSAGVIEIGQWRFPDWKVHGVTDVKLALAESNDIFFYAYTLL